MSGLTDFLDGAIARLKIAADLVFAPFKDTPGSAMHDIKGVDDTLARWIKVVLPGLVKVFPEAMVDIQANVITPYITVVKKQIPFAYKYLMDMGLLDATGVANLEKITDPFGNFKPLINGLFIIMTVINYLTSTQSATMGKITQQYNSAFAPNTLDAASAVRLAAIAPERYADAYDTLRKNGLDDKAIDGLFISAYRLYDEGTVRELFLRGEITAEKSRERLREMQYTDTRIDELTKLWNVIPPINDIIHMAVREAFSDSQIQELGLDLDFPADVSAWSKKQGLSDFWAHKYWQSHWELPSAQMGFEMLHRGKISENELRGLLKALDISPRWHEPLMQIAYNNMTRVDVRRIFEMGLLTPDELTGQYVKMGYSPSDAHLMTKWTETEYNQNTKDVTKTELLSMYFEGFMTLQETYEGLTSLGYKIERIDGMIELASYKRALAGQKERVTALRTLFIAGEATELNVRAELSGFRIDDRRIDELLDLWTLQRMAGIALPTKAELDKWLTAGIIGEADYRVELHRLGYEDRYIDMYLTALTLAAKGE